MRKLSILLFAITFFLNTQLQAYSSDPKEFIEELVNDALSKLASKNLEKDIKINFIENIALENVDINALGLYTLGELRKSSSKEDLVNYQQYFLFPRNNRQAQYLQQLTYLHIEVCIKQLT